jgi:hypothetical protein
MSDRFTNTNDIYLSSNLSPSSSNRQFDIDNYNSSRSSRTTPGVSPSSSHTNMSSSLYNNQINMNRNRSYTETEPDLLNRNSFSLSHRASNMSINQTVNLPVSSQPSNYYANQRASTASQQQIPQDFQSKLHNANNMPVNKEMIKQLKSNIELLFKGTRYEN